MSSKILIQVGSSDLALFKYILESYENLATVSTKDASIGLVELYVPKGNLNTLEALLDGLRREIGFQIVEKDGD